MRKVRENLLSVVPKILSLGFYRALFWRPNAGSIGPLGVRKNLFRGSKKYFGRFDRTFCGAVTSTFRGPKDESFLG